MKDFGKTIFITAQILAYAFAAIVIVQMLRAIFGGTWAIEDIILAFIIFNLTVTFGTMGYLINLNNKISRVNTQISNHISWHKGKGH